LELPSTGGTTHEFSREMQITYSVTAFGQSDLESSSGLAVAQPRQLNNPERSIRELLADNGPGVARSPRELQPPLCVSDSLCFAFALTPFRWCRATSARWPGGGGVTRGNPHLFLLFVIRPGGGACAARHADAGSGNLDRQCRSFRAGADSHAADAAIPRARPSGSADNLFGNPENASAPAGEPKLAAELP